MDYINRNKQILIFLLFIFLGVIIGAIISPFIIIILPTFIFGKKIGLYFLGLLPFCSLIGMIIGGGVGIAISILKIRKYKKKVIR